MRNINKDFREQPQDIQEQFSLSLTHQAMFRTENSNYLFTKWTNEI